MRRVTSVAIVIVLSGGILAAQDQSGKAAQEAVRRPAAAKAAYTAPRTPDGQPDLQGTWVNFDSTPFESAGPEVTPGVVPGVGPPDHWTNHDSPTSARRTAMVVDPPDGNVPVLPWAEAVRDYNLAHLGDSWVHETPWVRCITRGVPGGMFPAAYNNGYRIIQTP